MNRFVSALIRRLKDDSGFSLPEVMVSVLVSAIVMGLIVGSITAMQQLYTTSLDQSQSISDASVADSAWRADVREAVAIVPTNSTDVTFVIPGGSGGCTTDEWVAGTSLKVNETSYSDLSGAACSGTATATSAFPVTSDGTSSFTFENPSGRQIIFTAGAGTFASSALPSGITPVAWDSKLVGVANLSLTTSAGDLITSMQTAANVVETQNSATTAPSVEVAAGQPVTSNEVITTVAGTGAAGAVNGTGTAASLKSPSGTAMASDGNLYVADTGNDLVREVTPAGVVTTLAGTAGTAGYSATTFEGPTGVASPTTTGGTPTGTTLYVADGNMVRKITLGSSTITAFVGSATNVAGSSNTGTGTFSGITGIAYDPTNSDLYVTESGNNDIRQITSAGVVTTLAGGTKGWADGTGTAAKFSDPTGIAFDIADGDLYVTDTGNNDIRQVTTAGVVKTSGGSATQVAGSTNGQGNSALFSAPKGITYNPSNQELYIADSGNSDIRQMAPTPGNLPTTYPIITIGGLGAAGNKNGVTADAKFDAPAGITVTSSGILYVADTGNDTIREIQ